MWKVKSSRLEALLFCYYPKLGAEDYILREFLAGNKDKFAYEMKVVIAVTKYVDEISSTQISPKQVQNKGD